jgi:hypothetical protein
MRVKFGVLHHGNSATDTIKSRPRCRIKVRDGATAMKMMMRKALGPAEG